MVLSRRERFIVLGTALVLLGLAVDHFALSPLLEGRSAAEVRKWALQSELDRAAATMKQSQELAPRWREMVRAGMKADPADAEGQALRAIRDWAAESGVTLSLLKPDRLTEKTRLPEIAFQAAGTGSMDSVSRLLWRIQSAAVPIRITELQLTTRKEGAADLTVQLRLSTVYMPGGTRLAAGDASPSGQRGVRE